MNSAARFISYFWAACSRTRTSTVAYTFGVLDVASVLWLVDYLGFGNSVSARHLFELIRSFLGR